MGFFSNLFKKKTDNAAAEPKIEDTAKVEKTGVSSSLLKQSSNNLVFGNRSLKAGAMEVEIKDENCSTCLMYHRNNLYNGDSVMDISGVSDRNIVNLVIPDLFNGLKVDEAQEEALNDLPNLESVTFARNMRWIFGIHFANCPKLKEFKVKPGATDMTIDSNGFLTSVDKATLFRIPPAMELADRTLIIDDAYKVLQQGFANDCQGFDKLVFKAFPEEFFWGMIFDKNYAIHQIQIDCDSDFQIVDGNIVLSKDGETLVSFCRDIKCLVVPASVRRIGDGAFLNAKMLEVIDFSKCSHFEGFEDESGNLESNVGLKKIIVPNASLKAEVEELISTDDDEDLIGYRPENCVVTIGSVAAK